MKNSHIILIALGTIIIFGLYGFNRVLVEKYKKGEFDRKVNMDYEIANSRRINLPDFKYLVINGAIINKERKEILPRSYQGMGLSMRFKTAKNNRVLVPNILTPYFKHNLKNDTLYVTVEKEKVNEKNIVNRLHISYLYFSIKPVASIYCTNGLFFVDSLIQEGKNLNLYAQKDATLNINAFKVDTLSVFANKNAGITFDVFHFDNSKSPDDVNVKNPRAKALKYSIRDSARITINNPNRFQKLIADKPSNFIEYTSETKTTTINRGTITKSVNK